MSSETPCPRCHCAFTCNADCMPECPCSEVVLSEETRAFLRKTSYGCLCNDCLRALNALVEKAAQDAFPSRPGELKEGVHYTTEEGLMVFTEYYHILRGDCCGSGCRHCPYGKRPAIQ